MTLCFQKSVAILPDLYLSFLLLASLFIPAGTPLDAQQRKNNNTNGLNAVIVLLKAYQNTERIFKNMTYDVTMTSLLKTMGKFGPPRN